jgi:phosphomannomutase
MHVNPSIFKAYDIRGVYPTDLDEAVAYRVGRAFVSFLGVNQVIVGRDMRLSGPALVAEVTRGLTDQGADVIDIGMVSTDQYYFACATLELPGLMVTASHNPKAYNGFKMVRKMPYLLSGDAGIQDIRKLVESEAFPKPDRQGRVTAQDFQNEFVEKVLSIIDMPAIRPLRVLADTGNGMVGPILQEVYRHLPVQLTGLYLEPDGNMPNHGLDPLMPENRAELQLRVVAEHADVGFAFDGDGDRFFVIDDRGQFVPGDFFTAIMGRYMLGKVPGANVIYDVRYQWHSAYGACGPCLYQTPHGRRKRSICRGSHRTLLLPRFFLRRLRDSAVAAAPGTAIQNRRQAVRFAKTPGREIFHHRRD